MNELRRMVYLDALGVDSYVSRAQLPGAATTRRLALKSSIAAVPAPAVMPSPDTVFARPVEPAVEQAPLPSAPAPETQSRSTPAGLPVPPFSINAIRSGRWLWLELCSEMPLTSDQVWLIEAMSVALEQEVLHLTADGGDSASVSRKPKITQFDWPLHNNHQLGLDADAARASLIGYVERVLQQHRCQGLVLMGQACEQWVSHAQLEVPSVTIVGSAQVLADSSLKRQVWRDLLTLVAPR